MLDIEEDKSGDMWAGMMYQGAVAQFDPQTEQLRAYRLPPECNDDAAQPNMLGMKYEVDGKMWVDSPGHYDIFRLDVKTGAYEKFEPMKQLPDSRPGTIYGIDADSHNNIYFTDYATDYIGRIDANEKKFPGSKLRLTSPALAASRPIRRTVFSSVNIRAIASECLTPRRKK